jgi:hypothetical protein
MRSQRMPLSKRLLIGVMLSVGVPSVGYSQEITGTVVRAYADPSAFVVALDVPGACGSGYFRVERQATNFKEMVAVLLTAFSTGSKVSLYQDGCVGGSGNRVSHGGVIR